MLETSSRDILYIVLSFCVLWVTVFLCWTFFYFIRILRNALRIVEEFRTRIQFLTEAVDCVRGKVETMSEILSLVTNGVTGYVKKTAERKASEWINKGAEKMNESAKEAVDKAVEATAKKMKRMAKKL
ncbi:hypothetical protein KKA13_01085 [Patescibacteria group bacterium]|nr:hypothetical protein [Patescibacteria group bacterium]MBU1613402.1 hypothetical protein [Patescibacteria group bacterium]